MRRYVPALDSLRAIAVLFVLGYHYGLLDFGWMGVQIFFVLSGYLITGILLEAKARPLGEYLRTFYMRRSLRIFPLYFTFLLVASALTLSCCSFPLFNDTWMYMYTYTLNWIEPWRMLHLKDDRTDVFYHLWTLSIEEQFYLIWPWLVFFLSRYVFKILVGLLIVGPPILRLIGFESLVSATGDFEYAATVVYCLTPYQLDAFAWGALIAALPAVSLGRARILAILSVIAVVICGFYNLYALRAMGVIGYPFAFGYPPHMTHNSQYAWGYTLLNVASAAVILFLANAPQIKGLFAWPALVRVGKVSYGMYVLHVPVLLIFSALAIDLKSDLPLYLAGLPIYCALVWLCAELSFRYLETPFLRLKSKYQ